jgi:uncharacterized membrane protein YoaK (UPF0700 family)
MTACLANPRTIRTQPAVHFVHVVQGAHRRALTPFRAVTTALRDRLVVLLAVVSGATDATGFLALGGAFASVMTGNMVLVGVAVGSGDRSLVELLLFAIGGYVAGAALGARVAGAPRETDTLWPRAVSRALLVELGLFAVFAVVWWALGSDPDETWATGLLGLTALALGIQSSAIQRFGVPGLSTTYLTGTLTTVVIRLVGRQPLRTVRHSASLLLGLVVGAGVAAALVTLARPAAPAVQVLLLTVVVVAAHRSTRVPDAVASDTRKSVS